MKDNSKLSNHVAFDEIRDVENNIPRDKWKGKLDFIMSCIGYAVGLGNIWRFPYLAYRNGGAAFLIPYLLFLVLIGIPQFFLEISFGQFFQLSPITIWNKIPILKGLGWGMIGVTFIVCIYYNVILAWTLYYLFVSFSKVLPWTTCSNVWNTVNCIDSKNHTDNINHSTTPSEEFWEKRVLKISSGIEELISIQWELLGCLILAWLIVFFCLFKGIKTSRYVVYVTGILPYLILLILLIRGVTLPGALDGLKFYIIPKWSKLLELKVWGEAAMQIFYSVGPGWGVLITMSSYNKHCHNCYNDAILVPLINCTTSIFTGIVIFSIIGFMAHETNSEIEKVVTQGPGLVFVIYPAAVALMPISQLWSVLFFIMLFMVGLCSQFAAFETIISSIVDEFPKLRNKKILCTIFLCIIECLLGILCITRGGIYVLQLMDWYSASYSLMVISFLECMGISWIYGITKFYDDIQTMLGFTLTFWWKACWKVITPILICFILVFSIITTTNISYGEYTYPIWAISIGWGFAIISIIPIPVMMMVYAFKSCCKDTT
jgi:solute carrier family 6 amino acid transporter-like protein 5/7/9/14